ncbi:hypothetical protein E2C01_039599 [Portunus trituberculatus]|uniref:Uncharacterized protein n=1 Tax=Portunus trituberculatus TaxID=210409 RepID=A0A5B7FL44_PORTR|nr:hypothetical protein [Portunus trituberculatus]
MEEEEKEGINEGGEEVEKVIDGRRGGEGGGIVYGILANKITALNTNFGKTEVEEMGNGREGGGRRRDEREPRRGRKVMEGEEEI